MNKKIITLAVAAAMVAPAAALAEATLYGTLHQSIDYIDQDDIDEVVSVQQFDGRDDNGNLIPVVDENGNPVFKNFTIKGDGFSGWTVSRADGRIAGSEVLTIYDENGEVVERVNPDRFPGLQELKSRLELNNGPVGPSNRVGVKGSEDLGNGLKAIYQVEFGVRLADGDFSAANGDRGSISMRNTFVGLAGGFGTFVVGRHDTPLKISTGKLDMFADTIADYNGPLAFNDVRADNAIAYISPSFSGFQAMGAVHAGGGATVDGRYNVNSDSLAEAWSLAAIYSNGPFYASAAYESLSEDMTLSSFVEDTDLTDDFTKWRFGLGLLDWNGFSLTGVYEDRNNTGFVNDQDSSSWMVQAGYAFGNSGITAGYGSLDRDADFNDTFGDVGSFNDVRDAIDDALNGDLNQWTISFDHNFSKRTKAYVMYTNIDDDSAPDWDAFSLGMIHKF